VFLGAKTAICNRPCDVVVKFYIMLSDIQPAKPHTKAGSQTGPRLPHYPGIDCAMTRKAHGAEISMTVQPLANEEIMEMFSLLSVVLEKLDATLVHLTVFGSVSASAAGMEAMRQVFGNLDWPVTWVEGAACDGGPIAGIHVFALTGSSVKRIVKDGLVVGSVIEDETMRQCLLGGMGPGQIGSGRAEQTRETLQNMEEALAQAGFSFGDVVRTWFYLDNLLSWYGDFNQVRTHAYSQIQFRTGSLPTSTGISGRNPRGTALTAAAWAVQPLAPSVHVEEVASPLQCPAPTYGSSFSRAMEISSACDRRLLVSGTASIAPDGKSLWKGDVHKQVDQTMKVVESILHSRKFSFSDLTCATAYFKHPTDVQAFKEWCSARDLSSLPVVLANCGICRDDLLFEFEADCVIPKTKL
jgi:enamine deaminase RidA (YjgF/YER057c/UK114 family)